MARKVLLLITGMLLVMVTGVFWGTWYSLSRTMEGFSSEIFITIGRRIIDNVAVGMSVMMPLSIIGLLILLITAFKSKMTHFYWLLASLVCFILVLVITVLVEVPIDNQVKIWTADTIPPDWQVIRERWEFYHTDRTFLSLAGIACYIMAVIKRYS
jgi:uncharacterized membrane protein